MKEALDHSKDLELETDIDFEIEIKDFLQGCLSDAVNNNTPVEALLHRAIKDYDHDTSTLNCECNPITIIVPYCSFTDIDDLYKEFLKLSRQPTLFH